MDAVTPEKVVAVKNLITNRILADLAAFKC